MLKAQSRGFTLVELMVVIAIIGLLGAVAIPSYSRYTQESRRMDANVGLRDAAQVMERCRTQQFSYIGCENTPKIVQRDASPDGYYQLAYTGITATTFTITATPTAGRAQTSDADCQAITINQTGQTAPLGCWK